MTTSRPEAHSREEVVSFLLSGSQNYSLTVRLDPEGAAYDLVHGEHVVLTCRSSETSMFELAFTSGAVVLSRLMPGEVFAGPVGATEPRRVAAQATSPRGGGSQRTCETRPPPCWTHLPRPPGSGMDAAKPTHERALEQVVSFFIAGHGKEPLKVAVEPEGMYDDLVQDEHVVLTFRGRREFTFELDGGANWLFLLRPMGAEVFAGHIGSTEPDHVAGSGSLTEGLWTGEGPPQLPSWTHLPRPTAFGA